jgi:hypothetical protein
MTATFFLLSARVPKFSTELSSCRFASLVPQLKQNRAAWGFGKPQEAHLPENLTPQNRHSLSFSLFSFSPQLKQIKFSPRQSHPICKSLRKKLK